MTDSEKLKLLIDAIQTHRDTVWKDGPVDHPDDAELYEKLDAVVKEDSPA